MTEEGTYAAEKKGTKKEGKKRAREESDSEVVEVAMPPRKKTGQELEVQWKKWVVERLEIAEARSERIEAGVGKIQQTLEAVCGLLRRMEEGVPDESEQGSDTEAEQTLREVVDESEKADEAEEKTEEESEKKDSEEVGDVEMEE
jgi:hypothetical protein